MDDIIGKDVETLNLILHEKDLPSTITEQIILVHELINKIGCEVEMYKKIKDISDEISNYKKNKKVYKWYDQTKLLRQMIPDAPLHIRESIIPMLEDFENYFVSIPDKIITQTPGKIKSSDIKKVMVESVYNDTTQPDHAKLRYVEKMTTALTQRIRKLALFTDENNTDIDNDTNTERDLVQSWSLVLSKYNYFKKIGLGEVVRHDLSLSVYDTIYRLSHTLTPRELVDILIWINEGHLEKTKRNEKHSKKTYIDTVLDVSEVMSVLYTPYIKYIKDLMNEWLIRIIEQDLNTRPEVLDNNYITLGPSILFESLHAQLEIVNKTNDKSFIKLVYLECCNILKKYCEQILMIDVTSIKFETLIALINNCIFYTEKYPECRIPEIRHEVKRHVDEVVVKFYRLSEHFIQVLVKMIYDDVKSSLSDISRVIATFKDYRGDIEPHLNYLSWRLLQNNLYTTIVNGLIKHFLNGYAVDKGSFTMLADFFGPDQFLRDLIDLMIGPVDSIPAVLTTITESQKNSEKKNNIKFNRDVALRIMKARKDVSGKHLTSFLENHH